MSFDPTRVNWFADKLPKNRPGMIMTQGKTLWKCNVCFNYNPHTSHVCANCGLKNPTMMGMRP